MTVSTRPEETGPGQRGTARSAGLAEILSVAVGPERVRTDNATLDRYARTTGTTSHRPAAVVYPDHADHVQALTRAAAAHGFPLYPISRGRNWGYGDAAPPTNGQVVVDLSGMNRIIEVNTKLAYAVIEPGVTQGQLADYLRDHHTDLWLDVTGAGREASIVGNTLERGFGHTRYGDHFPSICGMDVVLADGRLLRTGFGHYDNAKAARAYRYGLGPFLDGLFTQSNLGIVTRMGIWLMPEPDAFCAFFFRSDDDAAAPDLVRRLAPLRRQGLLQSTIHIGNDLRVLSGRTQYPWNEAEGQTPLPDALRRQLRRRHGIGAWNGLGAIYGTTETVAATRKTVRRALKPYRPVFLDDRRLRRAQRLSALLRRLGLGRSLHERLETVTPVYGLLKGQPSDEPLRGTMWRVRDEIPDDPVDPRDAPAGLLWISPVLPMSPEATAEVRRIIEPIYNAYGFDPLITFTMITERAMICVSNLAFDRRDTEESAKAVECYHLLTDALMDAGYPPYRTGGMGFDDLGEGSAVFWNVVGQIKQSLDPQGIISPGRYTPRS